MKIFYLLGFLIFGFCLPAGMAQIGEIPRDTSYSIRSVYLKLHKKYPFIKPISPETTEKINVQWDVVYKALPAHQLKLDVFYPKKKNRKRYPGVLLIHGGGWNSGSKSHQVPMARQLAKKGYVAVAVEYRLSPEAPYPAAVFDLKEAVRWMRAHTDQYGLDTNKIAALGCSAGAQLASLIGVTNGMDHFEEKSGFPDHSSTIQAVINIDGIVSFVHPEADSEGESASKWLGGTRQSAAQNWKEASPLEYVDSNTPPFLFVNSAIPRFHAGRDDLIRLLDKHDIYSEVHTIPGTPHSFWLVHPWFEPTLEYTLAYLNTVFKNK